jgi:hypothetical protein
MYDERRTSPPVQLQHPLDQLDHPIVPGIDIAPEYGKCPSPPPPPRVSFVVLDYASLVIHRSVLVISSIVCLT